MTQLVGFVVADLVSVGWALWGSFGWTTCGLILLGVVCRQSWRSWLDELKLVDSLCSAQIW